MGSARRKAAPRAVFAWALCVAGGCAGVQRARSFDDYCVPPAVVVPAWRPQAAPRSASRSERVAALLDVTSELSASREASGEALRDAQATILRRVQYARSALEATVAELNCEDERADQLADYLQQAERRSVLRLTIASILVGTATGITSAFLSSADSPRTAQNSVAVVGGSATAALALAPLFQRRGVRFDHQRNMLTDIWQGPAESAVYPAVVWAYLVRPEFSNQQTDSIRSRIVSRWAAYGGVAPGDDAAALLFGAGGVYDADALRQRAAMLDQVKAEVQLLNQEFSSFMAALF